MLPAAVATLLLAGATLPVAAATLTVAEGGPYPTLPAAIAAAADGDTVQLGAGTRYECGIIRQRGLILQGAGAATVLTDRTCADKALLVVQADGVVVRDLVLARARVPDGNGAGIRLEGQGLTLERVTFDNDQVGLLAGAAGPGRIAVDDCTFSGGGTAGDRPTAALQVGQVAVLDVQGSRFIGGRGSAVVSAAGLTRLAQDVIEGGASADAGPAVQASGMLVMEGNTLAMGPHAGARAAAVEASGPMATLRDNRLQNTTGQSMHLLLDWTGADPVMSGNVLARDDGEVSTVGSWRHRAGGAVRDARALAGQAKEAVRRLFR